MAEHVEYVLNLKDNLSGKVHGAEGAVKGLESALGSAKGMLASLGVGFAIFKGMEFVHEGIEAFHKLHAAEAQVEAGLKSTGEAAGLNMTQLQDMAKGLSSHLKYSRAEITEMQSVLITFPSVTKATFEGASQAILDMSTRMNQDVKGTTVQIGKALQDPIHGITALKRVGVNFTEAQKDLIKSLVDTGQAAKAQQLILKELSLEFAGSAQAAFDADPLAMFNKTMGSLKMTMGELAMGLLKELLPTLMKFANLLKTGAEWIKKNKTEIVEWSKALIAAVIAFKTMQIVPAILLAIENAAVAAAMGVSGFGASLMLAINPVTLLAVAVAGLVLLYERLEQYQKNKEKYLGDVKSDEEDFVKQGMEKYKGQKDARQLSIRDEEADIARSRKGYNEEIANIIAKQQSMKQMGIPFADLYKHEDLSAYTKEIEKLDARTAGLADAKVGPSAQAKKIGATVVPPNIKSEAKATGSKAITINISIGKLIESFKIQTDTMGETANSIKEKVAETLLSAINDSQIVAGI